MWTRMKCSNDLLFWGFYSCLIDTHYCPKYLIEAQIERGQRIVELQRLGEKHGAGVAHLVLVQRQRTQRTIDLCGVGRGGRMRKQK